MAAASAACTRSTTTSIHRKLKQYFEAGVKEVWLINPADRTVEVWTGPTLPELALTGDESVTSALLPGFTLALADLFS